MSLIPIYEPDLKPYRQALLDQFDSGWIGPGAKVAEFARLLGEQFGRHCTVAASGTSALMLAYLVLDLPPGATLCCPDYGLPACQNAARLLGFKVRLVDVRPETGCMDPDALAVAGANGDLHCVVFVDHNGYAGEDLQRVRALCDRWGTPLIEDSAVALGCPDAGRTGSMSILSFSVPKVVTTGQGGAVLTARADLAERLEQLVDQGGNDWRKTRLHSSIGGNFRMTDLQAALGVAQLRDLSKLLEQRTQLWSWYRESLEHNALRRQCIANDVHPSGWIVTTMADDVSHADAIIKSVQAAGFDCKRLYHPVHRCLPYLDSDALYPGAVSIYDRLIYLPSSLNLTREQVDAVCSAIGSVA